MKQIRALRQTELSVFKFLYQNKSSDIKNIYNSLEGKYKLFSIYRSLQSLMKRELVSRKRLITGIQYHSKVFIYSIEETFLNLLVYYCKDSPEVKNMDLWENNKNNLTIPQKMIMLDTLGKDRNNRLSQFVKILKIVFDKEQFSIEAKPIEKPKSNITLIPVDYYKELERKAEIEVLKLLEEKV